MTIGPAENRDPVPEALRRLGRQRGRAQLVLLFERAWPALWPAFGIAGLFLCVALLDLLPLLPPWPHAVILLAVALSVLLLAGRAVWRLRMPGTPEADRRLERASGLAHRPLAVLADKPAFAGADALWQAHVARTAAQLARLRVGLPRPGLAARDRRALRGGLVVALVASLVVAGSDAPLRLWRAVSPGFGPAAAPPASLVQAWITPPGYTGLPPVFLRPEVPEVSVPAGSHLTVSITGAAGEPSLTLGGRPQPVQALDAASFQADQDLSAGGRLEIRRRGRELAGWNLSVIADNAPVVRFPEPPGRARTQGRVPLTRLPWQVTHDYGVVSLQAELRLGDRPDAPPLAVPIPLPGGGAPKSAKGARTLDLTAHPWAGLPVVGKLVARDAPGLAGESAPAEFTLPERRFENPLARAIIEARKDLSRAPDERAPAILALSALAQVPDAWKEDWGGFLNLQAIAAQLRHVREPKDIDSIQARMWLLALHLEEGGTERTARALAEARQAVRELMDKQQRGEKIDTAELDRRLRAVEEALQKHLQALAEQARRNPDSQQFNPDAHQLDARDMQRLAEQARDAARQGKMDEAQQKLAELEQLLQELQNARPEHGQMTERERQRAEKRQRGQQQMNALQDMVQREGSLLDTAHGRDASNRDPSGRDPSQMRRPTPFPPRFDPRLLPTPQDGAQGQPPSPDQQSAARDRQREQAVQGALRRAVGELMQQYGDLTGEIPPSLGEADTAMRDAQQALVQNRDGPAATAEQKAIEALQKGGRSMSMTMAQQFGRQPGQGDGEEQGEGQDGSGDQAGMAQDGEGDGDGVGGQQYGPGYGRGTRPWDPRGRADRRADDRRDPLGRPLKEGTSGIEESGDVQVPEKMEEARTRAIQEELRRRDSERGRPQFELDYIERLLKQF